MVVLQRGDVVVPQRKFRSRIDLKATKRTDALKTRKKKIKLKEVGKNYNNFIILIYYKHQLKNKNKKNKRLCYFRQD
jgi:hypothetical protein